ncbi:pilin [Candidatus Saccharibacteria bacterium]|nr:pilin [Candidatus Saccharibacteria bacterium]
MFRILANALDEIGQGAKVIGGDESGPGLVEILGNITNVIFFIVGFLAVAILIYGGVQYIISEGNASKVERAKSTIQWSIVGLIVCIASWAIVNFVVLNVVGNGGSSGGSSDSGSGEGEGGGGGTPGPGDGTEP